MADTAPTDTIHPEPLKRHDNGDGTFSPVVWSGGGAALAAGSAIIGKVGIDQTTPGTTNAVAVVSQAPVTVTLVDNSITSATGATQTLLAANAARKALTIVNPSWETTVWTIGPTGAAAVAGAVPGITLYPGDEWTPTKVPLNNITGLGTSTHKLIVLEG